MSDPEPEVAAPAHESAEETRLHRTARHANRARLYVTALVLVGALVLVVVLVVQNTHKVRVGWIFGHSNISLVYLIVLSTVLGWILGLATSIAFQRRTRRPR